MLPSEIEVEVEEVDVPPAIPTTAPAEEEQEVNPLCVDGPQRLEGSETSYECLLEFQAGGRAGQGRLAWTHDADAGTVDFALALPAEGWISVGFQSAENANSMPGALVTPSKPPPPPLSLSSFFTKKILTIMVDSFANSYQSAAAGNSQPPSPPARV